MGIMDNAVEAIALTRAMVEVVDLTPKVKEDKEVFGPVRNMDDFVAKAAKFSVEKGKLALQKEANKATRKLNVLPGDLKVSPGDSDVLKEFEASVWDSDKTAVFRRFEVQFNPSTLSVSGFGGGMVQLTNYASKDDKNRGVSYQEAKPHIQMSVQLIFDETDNFTAFPGDIMGFNVSNVGGTAINMGLRKLSGRPSVQTTVEGFLGAIRNEYTRRVAFCWGNMLYSGYVNRVNTRYTVFNPSGKPIRATVDLSIICADESVDGKSLGYWQDKYEEFFDADKSYSGARNGIVNLSNFSR